MYKNKTDISIIVPTLNEAGNIASLINRIDHALKQNQYNYELIIIDDHSSDDTVTIANQYRQSHPVRVFLKKGKRGKAYSILEGVDYAISDTIAMIDADLQYPPEALPAMIQKANAGAGIVIAQRTKRHTSLIRKLIGQTYHLLFNRWLLGFDFDIQSGLKVMHKEIFERVTLNPTAWTFDLELVHQAVHAGYSIETVPIEFSDRTAGTTKVNVFKTSFEIGRHAVRTKLKEPQPIPFSAQMQKKEGDGFHFKGKKYVPHNSLHPHVTAMRTMTTKQTRWLYFYLILGIALFIFDWHTMLLLSIGAITMMYFADLLYYFVLSLKSLRDNPEIQISNEMIATLRDEELPIYTVFCPLYKEWEVLPQFVDAMSKLDYPKDKLQVMLLLEGDDQETVEHARKMHLPHFFEIVVVPHSKPKTKPKACNYGLKITRGEYCVIYDAEDIPDPDQLKKAILAFRQVPEHIICIQAKLNFYNSNQNLLTRLFTAEYSMWFDLILSGLHSIQAPIPLGGTSNHFKTKVLQEVGGWDAFNVTEDCDLGIRLAKNNALTSVVESTTWEEANSDYLNWFKQRSRWIKGYIQTLIVHMRDTEGLSLYHKLSFFLIVGGKTISLFANPLMWLITILYFAARTELGPTIEQFFPGPILYLGVFTLIFGNFLYLYYYMIGLAKREQWGIMPYVFLIPFYWLAMSAAAWYALYKLITAPHHWYKTQHGLHLKKDAHQVSSQPALSHT